MKEWRFISNQNSTIVGINDAGIETFTSNMNRSLVRETIQNSLDAALTDNKEPITVEFDLFDLPRGEYPDLDNFQTAIHKCRDSNRNEPDALRFFDNAIKIVEDETISVLRISDHNTKGLGGSDTCAKGTDWSRLVKESGSSNKGEGSGGSFGIGKSAAFACSDLRTVFYSSRDSDGLISNIGVARLVSFEDEELGWTTGVGYYSDDDKFVAIHELADIDKNYKRMDSGTDIYVMGMHTTDNFCRDFINAVLLDFLVSLVNNKLIVKVQDQEISCRTLPAHMAKLNPHESEEIKDLLEYYYILTKSDPRIVKIPLDSNIYGKNYGFADGECTLYLMEGEELNRKIMITRRAGMRILEQNRISGSIVFSGVLVIEGDNMNAAFKKMEVPSHDAWEPGRCRGEEKKYRNILEGLKKYLRDVVKEKFGKTSATSLDAFGASDYLPDRPEDKDDKLAKDPLSTRIKNVAGRVIIPKSEIAVSDPEGQGDGGGRPDTPTPPTPPIPPKPGPRPNPGPNPDIKNRFVDIKVKKRLICQNAKAGVYVLSMVIPKTAGESKLKFSLSGEQSDYELPIKNARIISTPNGAAISSISGSEVYISNASQGVLMQLEITVDFDEYCMMEVGYAIKK